MGRKRGPGGAFAAGGGEDFVPELPRERYLNKREYVVTFGIDSSVCVAVEKDTEVDGSMADDTGVVRGQKEVWFSAWLMPLSVAEMTVQTPATIAMKFQLAEGSHAAVDGILDEDDDDVIASAVLQQQFLTSGATIVPWPLAFDLLAPRPILGHSVTLLADGLDNAFWTSKSFVTKILWGKAAIAPGDTIAYLQARIGT